MKQNTPNPTVRHVIEANRMVKELKDLSSTITFRRTEGKPKDMKIWNYPDAPLNVVAGRGYGQIGIVTGLMVQSETNEKVFHPVDWGSSKLKRVSHSSYGAEILACADADDRGFYRKEPLRSVTRGKNIGPILQVESRGLYNNITRVHSGRE